MVQDWNTSNQFVDAPQKDASYRMKVRCSANPACASVNGAVAQALVYTGDGQDIRVDMTTGVPRTTAVINWTARPQLSSVDGYDVFRGIIIAYGSDPNLGTLACLAANVPQGPVGSILNVQDAGVLPPLGDIYHYLVGHSSNAPGALDALGLRTNGTIRISPVPCP